MEQYIWLIDDDAAIRDSLSLLLSTVGWQTQAFDSAHAFQHQAGNLAELTGCMLLDIRMPGKTGLTLLDEWRQLGLTLPVIIMTGHGNIDLCRRAFKNGAFEFLTKPIDADLLFEVVGEAMAQQKRISNDNKYYCRCRKNSPPLPPVSMKCSSSCSVATPVKKSPVYARYRRVPSKRIAPIFLANLKLTRCPNC